MPGILIQLVSLLFVQAEALEPVASVVLAVR